MNRLFRISSPVGIPDLAGWPAYLAAIALAIAAAGTKELLLRIADTDAVFTTYFPAIAVAAWLGGFRAGLVATLASAAIDDLRFVDAGGSIIPVALPDQIRVVLFMVGGMLIAGLSGRLRGAARALAEQRVEVARSSDQLQVVLAAVTDAITVQRNDGQLLYANDAAAKLLGFASATELIAAPIGDIIGRSQVMDEEGGPFQLEHLPGRRALAGERTEPVLVRFRVRATGEERWSEVQAVPVFEADGRVRFAVNLFRDVTIERRRRAADRFLADATAVLAGRLDEKHALEELAQLAIQRLADWCVIDVIGPDGVTIESAIAHADPEPVEFGRRYLRPLHRDAVGGAAEVMRTGEPRWMPEITDRQVEEALAGTELADEVLGLGLRSYVCAPLMSRGRPIGAISMFAAESGRTYDEHDLAVAVELGERAGVALEHARIYRAADARRSELTAVLSAMREAVLVYDPDGHLVLRNPAAEALLAPDPPARLEQLARALDLDGDRPLAWSEMWDRPPLEIRRRDGSWLEVSTYRAVASTSEAESESRRERRTRRRGSTILVVRDVTASRAAQAAREAFMGLLSHELRTPITTIYGGTRLL
ncbi:MAG: PAS domain S-box protein, partial [Chloroflexi bacterium]|nr:PAS domain S-box protein [Chloroflexota bacterium]